MTDPSPDPSPETSFVPGPGRERAFRDALGCFGTGVTVVTALDRGAPLGMTANSFAAVSLDPALVLWCPAIASYRHRPFTEAEIYVIHVMAEDQQALALRFARSGDDFSGIAWQPGPGGAPVLPGCLARFECRRHAVHGAGDHSIIVGEVTRAVHRPGSGLMFKRGQYGGFAGLD